MKKRVFSIILLTATLFAQNAKHAPAKSPVTETWNLSIDGSYSVQYNPKLWLKGLENVNENTSYPRFVLYPLVADKDGKLAPRKDILIRAGIGSDQNLMFRNVTENYVERIKNDSNNAIVMIAVFDTADEGNGIFLSYVRSGDSDSGLNPVSRLHTASMTGCCPAKIPT